MSVVEAIAKVGCMVARCTSLAAKRRSCWHRCSKLPAGVLSETEINRPSRRSVRSTLTQIESSVCQPGGAWFLLLRFSGDSSSSESRQLPDSPLASDLGCAGIGRSGTADEFVVSTKISRLPRLTCHVRNRRQQLGCIFFRICVSLRFVILQICDSAAESCLSETHYRCQLTTESFGWQVYCVRDSGSE